MNNKIGLDIHTATAAAWNTSVRYYGGHFAIASSLHPTLDRFGVRFSAAPGAYVAHNRHIFDGPGFELQAEGRPIAGILFLCEVSSRAVWARALRMEACSPFVARHTGPAQDHVYEVACPSARNCASALRRPSSCSPPTEPPCSWAHANRRAKEDRILGAIEPALAARRLHAHTSLWNTPFPAEMADWRPGTPNQRDDALDAVAGCLLAEPVRLARAAPMPRSADWRGG